MSRYELWYLNDIGNRLSYISDVVSFEYARVLGDVGIGSFTFPYRRQLHTAATPDRRIAVYRQPLGGTLGLESVFMLRQFELSTSEQGQYQLIATGYDLNELLNRRIIAYYAGSAQANMTGTADDIMREIVRDNLVDNADYAGTPSPARDIDSYGFSVEANTSAGPTITKGFSWRNVLTVLQDLQADSRAQGTEVFWGVIPTSETTMQFRAWISGRDRTTTSGTNPIVFSLEWGNLASPRLVDDYGAEQNYIYAGGQGEESARIIQTASDTTRMNTSRLNRREGFAFSSGDTTAAVLTDARNDLERNRPTTRLYGDLLDTPLTPYGGLDGWNLGDRVTVNYGNRQFDVTIRGVYVSVSPDGNETIRSKIESD